MQVHGSATKAAAWSLTDALRLELQDQGTLVLTLHSGPVATAMGDAVPMDKGEPDQVVSAALDGLQAGQTEVLVDEITAMSAGRPAGALSVLSVQLS
jgi:short-subunit dehydrogenase